jgi:steroid delta-isomerase
MADSEHPARRAGFLSQMYVSEGNRDAWLDLWADEGVLADPVGVSPFDPKGEGHRGKAAVTAFYDNAISKVKVSFDYPRSYACANECAFIGTVYTTLPDGTENGSEGVFLYHVNDAGKILSLRAFWEHGRPTLDGPIHPPVGRER